MIVPAVKKRASGVGLGGAVQASAGEASGMPAEGTTQRLVLAQQAVDAKENEGGAIPEVLDRLTCDAC